MSEDTEFYAIVFIILTVVVLGVIGSLVYAQVNNFSGEFEFTSDPAAFLAILVITILFSLIFLGITYERDPQRS